MNKFNVICIKWGNGYSASDVNKLYDQIKRNTKYNIDFYCFTDDPLDLDNKIINKPLPKLGVEITGKMMGYLKEAGLCDDNLGGLAGQRVYFFDLDSLIVGNLDDFFEYPKDDGFYIINDWAHRHGKFKNKVGQASCYSFVVGTLGYIKEYFEQNSLLMWEKYYTASQEYLSAKVIEKYGKLNFWPDNWFKSFRFHCLPFPLFRHFIAPKFPKVKSLKMIAFHGVTGIEEALAGKWCFDKSNKKYPRGLKKIYKYVLPTKWIEEYWW